jgi:GAF domain-containing protein/HAMP domain-containing protein
MVNQVFDHFLRRIPVHRRIIGGFMLIMVIAGIVSPIILVNFNTLVTRLEQFTSVDAKIERLLLLASRRVAVSQLNLNRYIQDYVPSPYEALDDVDQAIQGLKEAQTLATNPEQVKTITLVIQSLNDYQQQIGDLQKGRTAGNNDETIRLESKLQKLGNDIGIRIELMVNSNVKQVDATNQIVLEDAQNSVGLGFVLMAIGFILAITFSVFTSLSITRPLAELRAGTEAFQKGDMVSSINTAGTDEFTVIAQIFNNLTKQIRELISNLENRVTERTVELNTAIKQIEHRAKQFETISKVSRFISSSASLQRLLPDITNVISEIFGFYHVGIFLTDASSQYAVLGAANSPGGKIMLERGHQLKIGEQGIVGYVIGTGNPRIALDVGEDATYFNNPDLPETHSEMALPLKIAGSTIGALDIQSMETNAFSNEDVEVLSTLADQVSLAIQNARLFDQTQKALSEAEAIYRQSISDTWSRMPQEQKLTGFRYTASGAIPLDGTETPEQPDGKKDGKIALNSERQTVSVPIILRGETIGTLSVQVPKQERVKTDQMDLIRAVADRVALSAENARLFEETTRRAERERIVSDITTKIRSSIDPQEMIKTAVEELQRALGATRVEIIPKKSSHPPDR